MKSKKLAVLLAIVVCLAAVLALSACKDDSFTAKVFDAYGKVTQAKQIKQTLVVKSGTEELCKTDIVYDVASGKATETTLMVDSAAPVTTTKDFDKATLTVALKADSFTELTENEQARTLTGTMSAENAKTLFGAGSTVNGSVAVFTNLTVVFALNADGSFASLTVSYATANGNNVTVTTAYTF